MMEDKYREELKLCFQLLLSSHFPPSRTNLRLISGKLVINILMFNFYSFQGFLRHPSPFMDSIIINIPSRPPRVLLISVLRSLPSPFPPESELRFNSHLSWKRSSLTRRAGTPIPMKIYSNTLVLEMQIQEVAVFFKPFGSLQFPKLAIWIERVLNLDKFLNLLFQIKKIYTYSCVIRKLTLKQQMPTNK